MTTLKQKAKYYFEITDKEWEDYIEPILKEQAKQILGNTQCNITNRLIIFCDCANCKAKIKEWVK